MARKSDFELSIASAYRGFDRQLLLWNEKAQGLRTVFDANDNPLDTSKLGEDELLFAILRWSALPGASRHHWGTDFDVYDRNAIPEDYQLQLNTAESESEGVFAPLHYWLDEQIISGGSCGFFRPDTKSLEVDEVGVSAERWHLSHQSVSSCYEQQLSKELLYYFYSSREDILLSASIMRNFDCIFEKFIRR